MRKYGELEQFVTAKVIDDVTDVVTVKGAHFAIKAAALHNYLLNKNSEYKVKYDNIRGGRIKYYYCNLARYKFYHCQFCNPAVIPK